VEGFRNEDWYVKSVSRSAKGAAGTQTRYCRGDGIWTRRTPATSIQDLALLWVHGGSPLGGEGKAVSLSGKLPKVYSGFVDVCCCTGAQVLCICSLVYLLMWNHSWACKK